MQKTVNLNVQYSLFEENLAQKLGGVFHVFFNGTLKVNGTKFTSNRASSDGRAIHMEQQVQMMVGNCTFEGNSASAGGSIDGSFGTQVDIFETVFVKSQATSEGGAVRVIQQGYIHIVKCAFKENYSPLGGAIHGWNNVTLIVCDSNFTKNTGSRGGAIHITNGDSGNIQLLTHNCAFH